MKNTCYILLFVALAFFSCVDKNEKKHVNVVDKQMLKNTLEDVNRYLLQQESKIIDDYICGQELDFIRTGTGLRYVVTDMNEGDLIKQGDVVTIEYEISSLSGDVFYSSVNEGVKTFVVGRGGVESGLEEAILKLRENESAILIIPSYLAHGLVGDGNMIPAKTTLLYKLKVIENRSNN